MSSEAIFALLISFASLLFGVYTGVQSIRRAERYDQRSDASELTMVIVKLEDINSGIGEIKSDIGSVKGDIKEITARLIIAEEQIKQANKTIDDIEVWRHNEG